MNKSMLMFVIGIVLILASALLIITVVNQAAEKSLTYQLGPHKSENKTVTLGANESYTVVITSEGNVSYAIYTPHAIKIKEGNATGTVTIRFNTTEDGKYIFSLKNNEDDDLSPTVVIMSDNDFGSILARELGSFLLCVIGFVVVLAGIITNIRAKR